MVSSESKSICQNAAIKNFCVYLAAVCVLLGFSTQPNAQQLQPGTAPIYVTAQPRIVAIGTDVTISGMSAVDGQHMEVKITVTPPANQSPDSGTPILLTVRAGPKGRFSVLFNKTNVVGKYLVKAVTPDGKGTADAEFTVIDSSSGVPATLDQAIEAADALIASAQQVAATAEAILDTQPESPSQQEMLDRLNQIKSRLNDAPQQIAQLKTWWFTIGGPLTQYPQAFPIFQTFLTQLEDWRVKAKDDNERIQAELQRTRTGAKTCDELDKVGELTTLIAYTLDASMKPANFLFTLMVDKAVPGLIDQLLPPEHREGAKFAFAEAFKVAIDGVTKFLEELKGKYAYTSDAIDFATKGLFGHFCEKFKGPLTVKMHVDFYERGIRWWSYDEDLAGYVVLRYPKPESSGLPEDSAKSLSGEFEGYATRYTLWDDFVVLYPAWLRYSVLFHRDSPPASISSLGPFDSLASTLINWGGRYLITTGPNSFSIPLTGELIKDKITATLGNATKDIDTSSVKGRVLYILTPPGFFIPEVVTADSPYQTAQWIISRIIGTAPKFDVTEGPVVEDNKKLLSIKRKFERSVDADDGSFRLKLQAAVLACNPDPCPFTLP